MASSTNKIVFNAHQLKNVISILKSLYNEVNFVFTYDLLTITVVDTSKMCAFHAALTPKQPMPEEDSFLHVFGILLPNLYTFLRSSKRTDNVAFSFNEDFNKLFITLSDPSCDDIVTKSCVLNNIIIPVVNMIIPYESYIAKAELSYTTFHAIISAISAFSNTFKLALGKEEVAFSSGRQQTDAITYRISSNQLALDFKGNSELLQEYNEYESKYMNNFLKKKISDMLSVSSSEDGTLLVQFKSADGEFSILLSPIQSEEMTS